MGTARKPRTSNLPPHRTAHPAPDPIESLTAPQRALVEAFWRAEANALAREAAPPPPDPPAPATERPGCAGGRPPRTPQVRP